MGANAAKLQRERILATPRCYISRTARTGDPLPCTCYISQGTEIWSLAGCFFGTAIREAYKQRNDWSLDRTLQEQPHVIEVNNGKNQQKESENLDISPPVVTANERGQKKL